MAYLFAILIILGSAVIHAKSAGHKDMKSKLQHTNATAIAGYTAVITAAAFWGGSGVFVKLIADYATVSATALAFWRDFTTFICLLVAGLAAIPGKIRLQRPDWRIMAGMGASLGLFHIF